MKKVMTILVAMTLAITMTACSVRNESAENDTTEKATSENTVNEDVSTTDDERDGIQKAIDGIKLELQNGFKQNATIEETVLYDENDVKITATELNYGNYKAELKLMIENNSDESLSFIAGSVE